MNKKKTLYTSLTALALASFSATTFADEVNMATEEVSVTLADEAVAETTALEASSEVAATEAVTGESSTEEDVLAQSEETVAPTTTTVLADTKLDASFVSGQWADDKGITALVTADDITVNGLGVSNLYYTYVSAGETYNFVEGLVAYKRIADTDLILVSAGGDTLAVLTRVSEETPVSEETTTQSEEIVAPETTTTALTDAKLDASLAAGQWSDDKGITALVSADDITVTGLGLSNVYYTYVSAGETYNFVEGLVAYKRTADTDLILVSAGGDTLAVLTRVSEETPVSEETTRTALTDAKLDASLAAGQWVDGKGITALVTADDITVTGLGLSNAYYTYVPAGETYNFVEGLVAYKRTADTDLILVSAGGDTLAVLTRVAEENPASEETAADVDTHAETRYDLLTTIDKSSLTAEQKSALAEKVAVAETAEGLAGIQAEVEILIGAGGAASAADKSEETTGKTSDKAVSTTAKGAGQVAASSTSTPSYSRVARAQAEKANAEKKLPSTGETDSVLALIGLGLASLGLLGRKRRYN